MRYRDPDSGLEFPSYEEYERVRSGYYDPPELSDEDLCDHSYVGDDGTVGRCWCGAQMYPLGGPPARRGGDQ